MGAGRRQPSRGRPRTLWLACLVQGALLLAPAGSLRAQELACEDIWAEAADPADPGQLSGVEAVCGEIRAVAPRARLGPDRLRLEGEGLRLDAPEGRLVAPAVELDRAGVRAESGCLELPGAMRCCGSAVERSAAGVWSMREPACQAPDGTQLEADGLTADAAGGLRFEGVRSPAPLALPLAPGLDGAGRSAGIATPTLGYRSDRGAGARLDGFLPLGTAADLRLGAFGETTGAAGIGAALRWHRPATSPAHLSVFGGRDPTVEHELRGELELDGSLQAPQVAGVALAGSLLSDATVARDWSWDPTARPRPDRHLAAVLWAGGPAQRLWIGTWARQVGLVAGVDEAANPAADLYGSLPAAGWAASHAAAGVGALSGALRFDRIVASPVAEPLNQLRLVTGGVLHALRLPALAAFPGAWLVTDMRFTDPESAATPFRDFRTQLWTSLELSSPWVGGGPTTWHLVALRARGQVRALDNRDRDGAPPERSPAEGPDRPIQLDIGIDQEVVSGPLRLSLPVAWLGRVDGDLEESLLRGQLALRAQLGAWRLQLGQLGEWDLEAGRACCWMGDAALALSLDSASSAAVDRLPASGRAWTVGGSWAWLHSRSRLSPDLAVPVVPLLRPAAGGMAEDGAVAGSAFTALDLTGWGVWARAIWLVEGADRPALDGALRVGHLRGLGLTFYGGWHPDDVALVQAALSFGEAVTGPWAAPLP